VAFAVLMVLSAQIRIPLPFTPVPMTLQTFFVALAGGLLGASWGAGSMTLYFVFGFIGLDVFAATSGGTGILLAPSFGYVIGFILSAGLFGFVREHSRSKAVWLLFLLLSQAIVFLCGVLGLMMNAGMTVMEAILKGVLPFLAGDALKITAAFGLIVSFDYFRKVTRL
jgi:biotin transport system substrate-specific component